jgi:hypothetical protein
MKKRTISKDTQLNSLKTGCSPCKAEAEKIKLQIGGRKVSEIKIDEIKKIVSSLFLKE